MIRAARIAAAAALPLFGLGALWVQSDRTYNTGTEWEMPIAGYDPRDYLRGHYVEFTYDWPGLDARRDMPVESLCLEGAAPALTRATVVSKGKACAHPLRPAGDGVYGWDPLNRGRLYIGQERAGALQRQLHNRDQRGIVTIRQREDGSFTPIAIRFRPLTPAEIAERDAPDEGAGDIRPPPPIRSK
jgi:hypothetical protein